MRFLRSNTAVMVTVGPFYDKTDGVTIEGSLTITNERITLTADTDDGSAPTNILDNVTGATSGTSNDLNYITGTDAGLMQLELSAANVNRLGRMFLSITDATNHVPVFHEFMVLPAMIYDSFVLGTDRLDTNVTHIADTSQTAKDVGAALPAAVPGVSGGLPRISDLATTADINSEVVDALATDTYAEPGQGAPSATTTLAAKINYLFKWARNKKTQTSTTVSFYDDAGSTVDQKATVSDDGSVFTRGELGTGP